MGSILVSVADTESCINFHANPHLCNTPLSDCVGDEISTLLISTDEFQLLLSKVFDSKL